MIFVGIDPGFSGAVAAIWEDGRIQLFDAPTHQIVTAKKHTEMSPSGMVEILKSFAFRECHVLIEKVATMPGQGIASSGRFMYGAGMWEGVTAALGIPYTMIRPNVWKKEMMAGLGAAKDAARLRACQLYPTAAASLARVKDDGRAEALLLAEYGRRRMR